MGYSCKIMVILLAFMLLPSCARAQKVQYCTYRVVDTYPHDAASYTQGLFFDGNDFYESAGQYGESSIRRTDLETGKVLQRAAFDPKFFVEGSCIIGNMFYILTWMERVCFVYDKRTFKKIGQFPTRREGWGLTTDGEQLIQSDGSAQLYFINPETFADKRSITVTLDGSPVRMLNELEYIDGRVWANIYMEDKVVVINPEDGVVEEVIDFSNLLPKNLRTTRTDVLNGIAYNPSTKSIYVTGKYWPRLYKVEIIPIK